MEVNKGDGVNPKIRSRLVAREIRMKGEEAIFAPTPPLESLRMVLSHATTQFPNEKTKVWDGESPDRQMIYFMDISRAYFNARVDESDPVYLDLPPELAQPGMCAMSRCWSSACPWQGGRPRGPCAQPGCLVDQSGSRI